MKLKDLKNVEKKEDLVVFKTLLRCFKERGNFNYLKNNFKNYEIVKNYAYNSRHSHRNENFLTNIAYWPTDIFGNFHGSEYILYFSILINNIDIKKYEFFMPGKTDVVGRLAREIDFLLTDTYLYINNYGQWINIFKENAYNEIISEALEKIDCIKGNKKENYIEMLNLIGMAYREKLPL